MVLGSHKLLFLVFICALGVGGALVPQSAQAEKVKLYVRGDWTQEMVDEATKAEAHVQFLQGKIYLQGAIAPGHFEWFLDELFKRWVDVERAKKHVDEPRIQMFTQAYYNKRMYRARGPYMQEAQYDRVLFELILNSLKIKEFEIHSPGGSTHEGYYFAAFIKEHKLNTRVNDFKFCASACTVMFAQGERRIASPDALFMFHQARYQVEVSNGKQYIILEKDSENMCRMLGQASNCLTAQDSAQTKNFVFIMKEMIKKYFNQFVNDGVKGGRDIYFTGAELSRAPVNPYVEELDSPAEKARREKLRSENLEMGTRDLIFESVERAIAYWEAQPELFSPQEVQRLKGVLAHMKANMNLAVDTESTEGLGRFNPQACGFMRIEGDVFRVSDALIREIFVKKSGAQHYDMAGLLFFYNEQHCGMAYGSLGSFYEKHSAHRERRL